MNRNLDQFLKVHIPRKGYHAIEGKVEVFDEKNLNFNCGCGEEHKVMDSFALIDFPIENKAVYLCPNNENQLNIVKAKGLFRIKGLKTIASYQAENTDEKLIILNELESRKKKE